MVGGGAKQAPESPKAVPAEQTRDSVSARLRNAFPHVAATCSRRVVESRGENLAGREILPRHCLDGAIGDGL
jgi:hypothetical protein